jgi:hypothetical protein
VLEHVHVMVAKEILKQSLEYWEEEKMTRWSKSASGVFSNYGFIHYVYDDHKHKWIMLLSLCKIELKNNELFKIAAVREIWPLF